MICTKKILFIGLLSILCLVTNNLMAQKKMPEVVLNNLKGEKLKVADAALKDGITIYSFWATWCGPCKKELNNIKPLYADWQKKYNVKLVAVSIDDQRSMLKVKPVVEGNAWTYDVLLDTNEELKRALGIDSVPYTLVVDKDGNIVFEHSSYLEGDEIELEEKLKEIFEKK